MTTQPDAWRGVYVIVTTPFKQDLSLDEDSLRRTVAFCLESGVHGLVATANASEVAYLTDDERRRVVEIVADENAGTVKLLAGVSSSCAFVARQLAQHARSVGADGIMAMPPTVHAANGDEIRDFYRMLGEATDLPIMLQNYGGPGGTFIAPPLTAELVKAVPTVEYVKEETAYSSVIISEVLALCGDELKGVMGGKAGIKLIDEHRRGACGTMPACEVSDVHVALWNALEAGDIDHAKHIYRMLLPLLNFEVGYGPAVYKQVLHSRGVIATPRFRQTGGRVLDKMAMVELDDILSDLAPFFADRARVAAE